MRKLLIGLVVVVLALVGVVAAFLFVPSPLQGWAAERIASLALGRQVTLGDPFRLRVWPPLSITAADVRIANADWGRAPEMVRIDALELSADLLAFRRDNLLKIDRLLLRRPQVRLERAEDGRPNWAFGGDEVGEQEEAPRPAEVEEIPGFLLGDVRIEDGLIAYEDRAGGLARRAEDVDLAIAQAGSDEPVRIEGGLVMDGQRAALVGSVARAAAVAAGESSPAELELVLPGGTVRFEGTLNSAAPTVNGRTVVDLPAPRELLAWLGQELALPDDALRMIHLETQLDVAADRVALEPLELRVDEVSGRGNLVASLGEPPVLQGALVLDRLNLDPYLADRPSSTAADDDEAPAQGGGGWSEAPIKLPLPLPVDLDVRLSAEGLKVRQLETGRLAMRVRGDRQHASVALEDLVLHGGQLTGRAEARPGERPAYALALQGQGVRLLPALEALAGFDRFDGRGELRLNLVASGNSQRDLVESAAGDGEVMVRDGAILGINIAGMIRQIMTLGLNPAAGQEQRTDFAEMGGSFSVANGIVRNEDLRLRAPVLRLDGDGTVDLPQRTLDYRVRPQVAATLEGQGAAGEPTLQAGVPFVVQGPLDAPAVRFDLGGTLTGAIDSPEDIARVAADLARNPQAVRALRDRFDLLEQLPDADRARELLEGVLGGGQRRGAPAGGAPTLEDRARGLLEGLGR